MNRKTLLTTKTLFRVNNIKFCCLFSLIIINFIFCLQIFAEQLNFPSEIGEDELKVGEVNIHKVGKFVQVEGRVMNVSDHPLKNIEIIVLMSGNDGQFITWRSSFLPLNPLYPKQISPFRVLLPYEGKKKYLVGGTFDVKFKRH
jgi:hypothetical protein